MEVRAAIQAVVLEHRRRYGYRRVTRELAPPRSGGEPQARGAADARRQPAGRPAAGLGGNHQLGARAGGVHEPGGAHEGNWNQPVVGGRHHLHPAGGGVRLPGRGAGCVLAQGGGLGAAADPGGDSAAGRTGAGHRATAAAAGPGAPLRSRPAVCQPGVWPGCCSCTTSRPA